MEMPKTIIENLNELELESSLVIDPEQRASWQTKISEFKHISFKRFTIRTKDNEIRVWRVK